MRPFTLLVLAATSVTICARALPKDDSINARDALPNLDIPAMDARQAATTGSATTAHVALTASTSALTNKAHKHKTGTAAAWSGAATSTAKPKGHHKHHAHCNGTLSALNGTNPALNNTVAASNCTLTTSNSTLAASNITEAAGTTSNVTATATTKTSTAEKKTGPKVAGAADAKPTAQTSANDLGNIIEELTGLDLGNVARDLPTRETKSEESFSFVDEYKW